ncbi:MULTISPECIES: hypothetical protein [unclassified Polaromonas]|uniref:hypothetical protein n=1 Tax=unclassified Polaromonas TaxID=2638319 RepID=UPI0018CA1C2B|nr:MULTISPECIES: hypothetical protein [unclassified Polaromonas]MBG6073143.1 hypothetical protein [Polaromonas sp. CG_9.7]MBG6115147.1 hypothetical protein [Polaromonas sp. CG_9.2]MDH6184976.1 hypothetical protein [Polaromonas sp. CG_23.6]
MFDAPRQKVSDSIAALSLQHCVKTVVKAWTAAIHSIQRTIADCIFRRPQGMDFHFQGVYQRRVPLSSIKP